MKVHMTLQTLRTRPTKVLLHKEDLTDVVKSVPGSLMAMLYCSRCKTDARFLSVRYILQATGVCCSTVYDWMKKDLVHWIELPSGHRRICEESLFNESPVLSSDLEKSSVFALA